MPDAAMVGRLGSTTDGFAPVQAIGLIKLALMLGSEVEIASNISCTLPASRSVMAGAVPLYGTCTSLVPAIALNNSPLRWLMPPAPDEPKFSEPGFFLSSAISSCTVDAL